MDEAPATSAETTLQAEARDVVRQLREELANAAKLGEVHERIQALERTVGEVRQDLRKLIEVFERLALIGQWAMKATPYILAVLAGSNLVNAPVLLRLLGGGS